MQVPLAIFRGFKIFQFFEGLNREKCNDLMLTISCKFAINFMLNADDKLRIR